MIPVMVKKMVAAMAIATSVSAAAAAGLGVTAIHPVSGTPAGGRLITIEGSGFETGASVRFGDRVATTAVVESPSTITAMTPSHAAGTADVIITNPDGTAGVLSAGYEFLDPQVLPRRQVRQAFANRFTEPVLLTHAGDGSDRVFVVELSGHIKVLPNAEDATATLFLDISDRVNDKGSQSGLLSAVFHPDYATNGRLYVLYSAGEFFSRLSEFRVSDDPDIASADSERIVLEVEQTGFHHNGDHVAFGPDGMLYIGQGSGGQSQDFFSGQDRTNLRGSMLRIDVDERTAGLPYGIPPDNPFVGNTNGWREEIWAYGMRQPWRFSFDRETGRLWEGDVGWGLWEEVNLIIKGGNYGWATMQGVQCSSSERHTATAGCDQVDMIAPAFAYGHSDGRGASVTGGYVYRGKQLRGLLGAYLYADFTSNRVSALRYEDEAVQSDDVIASVPMPASFGEDESGEVYIVSFSGFIYALEALPGE
jgi:glucose/arabinose dehydrogenase